MILQVTNLLITGAAVVIHSAGSSICQSGFDGWRPNSIHSVCKHRCLKVSSFAARYTFRMAAADGNPAGFVIVLIRPRTYMPHERLIAFVVSYDRFGKAGEYLSTGAPEECIIFDSVIAAIGSYTGNVVITAKIIIVKKW